MIARKATLSLLVAAASGVYVWSQPGVAPPDDLLDMSAASADIVTNSIRLPVPVATPPAPLVGTQSGRDPWLGRDHREVRTPTLTGRVVPPVAPVTPLSIKASPVDSPAPPRQTLADVLAPDQIPLPRPRPEHQVPIVTEPVRRQSVDRRLVTRVAMRTASAGANVAYADGNYTGPVTDAYYGLVQIQAVIDGGRLAAIKVLQYPSDRRTSVLINRQALPMLRDEVVAAQSATVNIISGATLTSEAFIRSLDGALSKARLN